ncbi:MAG TPA: glycosyl hydrolase family 18 protein [Spirochaetota bacterium]|nr:glycosyl hydrolase family 18 protein [Spirochaetota bacterium]
MRKIFPVILIFAAVFTAFQNYSLAADSEQKINTVFPVKFKEVWGYLMRGEEKVFRGDEIVTDVCYFSCSIDPEGKLRGSVNPPVLPELDGKKRRVHIVIADLDNTRLMNLILDPSRGARDNLVTDIVELSKRFDGVQIDFEAVAGRDAGNFLEFLRLIREGMEPGKIFSVALPAKRIEVNDAYDYASISAIADRVYIMAYDQHWSTSRPGPVASLSWCKAVMNYALTVVPSEKLIMGIPLYGRSWKNEKIVKRVKVKNRQAKNSKKKKKARTKVVTRTVVKSRSVKSAHIPDLIDRKNAVKEYSADTGFVIRYKNRSKEVIYCDDVNATMEKFLFYSEHIDSIGFWRLGMENRDLWKAIDLDDQIELIPAEETGAGE